MLSEVMVNPNGLGRAREYVEIYNRSSGPVDLAGWSFGDTLDMDGFVEVSAGLLLAPGQYGLVLDPDYFTAGEPYDAIPAEALVITIGDKTFGRYGLTNDATKTFRLQSPGGTVEELTYTPETAVKGYSLEKIDLYAGDGAGNWARSLLPDGTPGAPNSVRLCDVDAALGSVLAEPDTVRPPATPTIRVRVTNSGRDAISGGELVLFADADGDSACSSADEVLARVASPALAPRESAEVALSWEAHGPPSAPLFVAIGLSGDERPGNNLAAVRIVVGLPARSVRIDEIMALPGPGEGQWVELVNTSSIALSLAGCRLFGGRGSAVIVRPAVVASGDYLVLAACPDSVRLRYSSMIATAGLDGAFPHLNTSQEATKTVRLADATGAVVDRATYPVPESGRSLELVSLDAEGDDPAAWRTVWGALNATPGAPNQSALPSSESARVTIGPLPPADTVGISLDFPEEPVYLTLRVFDAFGREVRRLVDGERWSAHGHFRWDGLEGGGRNAPTGIYVLLVEAVAVDSGKSYRLVRSIVIARRR